MQSKEQAEDEELLEKFQDEENKHDNSNENSEMDQIDTEIEGADGEKDMRRNITQVEGYDQDEDIDKESEFSKEGDIIVSNFLHLFFNRILNNFWALKKTRTFDGFDDNTSQKGKSVDKIDLNSKINSFKPYLQYINFINQEKEPEFKRAKIVITLHIQLDSS